MSYCGQRTAAPPASGFHTGFGVRRPCSGPAFILVSGSGVAFGSGFRTSPI